MKLIELTQGLFAKVDDLDFERLNCFNWHAKRGKGNCWYAARYLPRNGQAQRQVLMHHDVLGIPRNEMIDHKDGNGLDNQRENLRPASHQENCRNRARNKNNTSSFKGVSYHRRINKWSASICKNYRQIHLGYFDSAISAAIAYDEAALKYHGAFARVNQKCA